MTWKGWDKYVPPRDARRGAGPALPSDARPEPDGASGRPATGDRGSRRGARRVIVTEERQVVEHELAKNVGVKGTFFQSKREALRWVSLLGQQDFGAIRNLRRQVRFPLQCRRPDGLMATVANYVSDFTYEEADTKAQTWTPVVEDVKPRGGLREDTYILKKKWVEAQYGITIRETH